jgi:hypothetical protein
MTPGVIAHQNLTPCAEESATTALWRYIQARFPEKVNQAPLCVRGWAPMNQHISVACTTTVTERFMCRIIIFFCFHRPLSSRRLALLGHDQLTSSSVDDAARLSFCKSTVARQSCLGLPFSKNVISLRVESTEGFHILRPKVNHNVALVNLMVRQLRSTNLCG